ncbi:uncharacterized protein BDZ99DRAFT_461568 [Mytilinidion resinicola]|uniref:Uncharacterized protein n=1 Tax=Mytilinidion resinicola TaxID=574789 RepID=A0A6A6YT20_9PEZI|nr:uncharacterized protein BDZ99DRAFT_461568 [Mytilinidion resinicola]KAF2811513.1 hypothetical protein BDZ99DRAFT_461568 [Mytilinidion resinicola]
MAVTKDDILQHEDAAKHSGTAAETFAKKAGLGAFSKQIGEFVKKLVGKKQKAALDAKAKKEGVTPEAEAAAAGAPAPAAAPAPAPAAAA